jgi:hypothetical protein
LAVVPFFVASAIANTSSVVAMAVTLVRLGHHRFSKTDRIRPH